MSKMAKPTTTMKAIRIQPKSVSSTTEDQPTSISYYSVTDPASSSDLALNTVPIPQPVNQNEILVRVHASTIIKDTLTWPEMYEHPYAIAGHDFSGNVVKVGADDGGGGGHHDKLDQKVMFNSGDHVYGMVDAARGQCWAEYVVVKKGECALKPVGLTWEQAASVPLSALTAWQALFIKGGVDVEGLNWLLKDGDKADADVVNDTEMSPKRKTLLKLQQSSPRVLITGASGGVGTWLVQLAKLAGCYVVCGTGSRARSEKLLRSLGGDEVVQYDELHDDKDKQYGFSFDTVIDGMGGFILEQCWNNVKPDGHLISIDSASFEFVQEHQHNSSSSTGTGTTASSHDNVKASFFIVEPSAQQLQQISTLIEKGRLRTFVGDIFSFPDVVAAYEHAHGGSRGGGKVILVP